MDRDLEVALTSIRNLQGHGVGVADEPTGKQLLSALGIEVPVGRVVRDSAEAVSAADLIGGPVGIKLIAHDLPHKSELGGVRGPLTDPAEIEATANDLLSQHDRVCSGVLVEAWHGRGVECFADLALTSSFGPLMSFGLGGLWVESLRDVQHRLAPLCSDEVVEMIDNLRAVSVLRGSRGHAGVDTEGLVMTLVRLSEAGANPDIRLLISEIEINPLLARDKGPPIALDCTVFLQTPNASPGRNTRA